MAEGEDLLELVDRHDLPACRRGLGGGALERPHRVLAGSQQRERPVLATGQHAAGERGEQPRPERRGLAAARRPHDPHQRSTRQPRHHLGHQPLAAEEQLGIRDVKRRKSLERAGDHFPPALLQRRAFSHRLQPRHVACQIVLGRAQARAFARRPFGREAQAPRRLATRPLAGGPMHAPRDTTARRSEPLDRDLHVIHRPGVKPRHGVHRVHFERAEHEQRACARCRRECWIRGRRQHEHWQRRQPVDERAQSGAQRHARVVDVVEHKQHRGPASRAGSSAADAASGGPPPAT